MAFLKIKLAGDNAGGERVLERGVLRQCPRERDPGRFGSSKGQCRFPDSQLSRLVEGLEHRVKGGGQAGSATGQDQDQTENR